MMTNRTTKALLLAIAIGLLVSVGGLLKPAVGKAQGAADTLRCQGANITVPKSWGVFRDSQMELAMTSLYFEEPSTGIIRRVTHSGYEGTCSMNMVISRN